jgi:hypothetical protein
VTIAATLSPSAMTGSAPGTSIARRWAVNDPKPTITASSATTSRRLSESKIAWMT